MGVAVYKEYLKELLFSYNMAVKEARSFYFNSLIINHKNNPRVLFDTINSIRSSPPPHALIASDDDFNVFLHDFVNRVMDLSSKISLGSLPNGDCPQCFESSTSFCKIYLNLAFLCSVWVLCCFLSLTAHWSKVVFHLTLSMLGSFHYLKNLVLMPGLLVITSLFQNYYLLANY